MFRICYKLWINGSMADFCGEKKTWKHRNNPWTFFSVVSAAEAATQLLNAIRFWVHLISFTFLAINFSRLTCLIQLACFKGLLFLIFSCLTLKCVNRFFLQPIWAPKMIQVMWFFFPFSFIYFLNVSVIDFLFVIVSWVYQRRIWMERTV